ncbi:hypothetical protein ACRC6Q_12710 [Planococcus sp. SE5232]|uniref:hypothetical protein n=1 Tax=unclassified Planococcus (in: firmicutes) TaxID=2662419 RepID=UPI001CBE24B3|nr:hypothetical protein [Planococcus sp. 4-30]
MRKGWISIIGGFVLGIVISFFTLEYNGWQIIRHGRDGMAYQKINDLDIDLLHNSFLIIVVSCIGIYFVLTLLEKRRNRVD